MQFKKIAVLMVFITFLYNCDSPNPEKTKPQIIPMPAQMESTKGEFVLDQSVGMSFDSNLKVSATFLKEFIEKGSAIQLRQNNKISFIQDDTISNDEGYQLTITPKQIEIRAKTDQGAFYAVQSLRQLLPVDLENGTFYMENITIPCVTITDSPQFKHRGMHLDVGRHFFSVDFIKKYIDALAMLKMNTFHWHLTEDQGWRIEIKKYPKLQEVAAFREQTLIGSYNADPQQFDGKRYGGFYTQEEIKDVVAYAQNRHVTIIPEIEMPGHAQAAISAYPELGCTGEQIKVAETWGVFDHIFCSKDETFEFLENVLDEVLELFPSKYIHIGGDEAPKTHWENCPNCQQRIKEEGLKDEHELQNYFITRIEKYLNGKGRQIIGWDEILEGGLAPNATVMSWRGTQGAIEAAKQHHNVIMTPTSHCYFDYKQSDNEDEPLANSGGFLPLEKVYSFNPIPEELTEEESQYVLGAQGNVWTEYVPNEKQVEYMVFPRILAMSEVLWTPTNNKNYADFIARVEHFHQRLDALEINYANHLYEVEGEVTSTGYKLTSIIENKTIRYTTDGTEPSLTSEIYSGAIPINTDLVIKAAIFNSDKKLGATFTQPINYHKALGKKININVQPSKTYAGSGADGLINGITGSDTRINDKEWLGFDGEDLEITIDLGEEMEINSIETRFYEAPWMWIYAPKVIEFGIDQHGINSKAEIPESTGTHTVVKIKLNETTRYIHLRIPNFGLIPEGKPGAGHQPWTFIDEIIVN
ncbi:glycoside hydrolase family 20 protein [Gelidibacter japonicus]|uniref:family 20 glycosylhydrolase n=1 Tax=Gelidibacter japonicus TaxID=1962232 RepID=UPI002020DE7F|nr:family 20 glycosylhydrolase [Gelidibacter japonicus]MCL8007466.1 glycoside hydrolase family 20 protein [Gelidibacter japonicus]